MSSKKGKKLKPGSGEQSLRRSISPRKEQYSSLLDEMIGCGDMVLLEPLTENSMIENLKKRYSAGDIYVSMSIYSNLYNILNWIFQCNYHVAESYRLNKTTPI